MKKDVIKILAVLLLILNIISCSSSTKDEANHYFDKIGHEAAAVRHRPEKIIALKNRELEKNRETNDRKFLISSKYVELFNDADSKDDELLIKTIPVVYELLILNNNEYDYISIACNFNLAHQFEHRSPKLSMQFLNEAIKLDDKDGQKYFLPHLYHLKGRIYYNEKQYKQALFYFNKCLQNLPKDRKNLLYIASMHNNFGLSYEKMGNLNLATEETKKAIVILEQIKDMTAEEEDFFVSVKGNLGFYYYQSKKYAEAELLMKEEMNYYKGKVEFYHLAVMNMERQFDLYNETNENDKMKEMINYGLFLEGKTTDIQDKIQINEMLQSYELKMNNNTGVKGLCKKLKLLRDQSNEKTNDKLMYISDTLNSFIIKSVDQEA
ncbi:hypothetical protein ACM46_07545 [Chryseobacterium angstadtii]|uniref:Uncharacterized protein n=1 Tax=Chryseobacterium angstadtii TaxID=558151 RepID=A0A0J7IHZ5_9FLAO|nr:tetratricopeptide repeat protein [Chryseobacterium angstadtii]KMQ65712.1 hypothetical protein ACM46_07545 [Chryseobacterium angstadtii]